MAATHKAQIKDFRARCAMIKKLRLIWKLWRMMRDGVDKRIIEKKLDEAIELDELMWMTT